MESRVVPKETQSEADIFLKGLELEPGEIPQNKPVQKRTYRSYNSRICPNMISTGRCFNTKCKFAHSYRDLDPLLCQYGRKCAFENCNYFHKGESIWEYCRRTGQLIAESSRKRKRSYAEVSNSPLGGRRSCHQPPPERGDRNKEEIHIISKKEKVVRAFELALRSGAKRIIVDIE